MNHCWHCDDVQYTTWTPGEARSYHCCFCGEHISPTGIVESVTGHGPYVSIPPKVTYVLPERPCPKRVTEPQPAEPK